VKAVTPENTLLNPSGEPDGGSEASLVTPGSIVGGLYRVVRCLGLGRMGGVFLCEVLEDGGGAKLPLVAVKLLSRSIVKEGERNPLYGRFHREVEAIFRVAHPNVVSAFQFINHEGLIGYSMDYVPGGNLASYLADNWPLEEWRVVGFIDHLSRGLEAIHEAGVVHRDLKPENILLTPQLHPKISDFGVAYCGLGSRLTANRALVGTIQYLSPEYLEKGVVSAQGDVYALGVVAYELVTGAAPFGGLGVYEAIEAKVNGGAPDPRESENEISDELAEVIQRALSPRLQERFRSAAEFNRAIRSVSSRAIRGKRIHQSSRLDARGEDKSEITEMSTQESRAVKGGRKTIALYVAVSVLIGMVVLSRWLMTNSRVGNPRGGEDGATSEANSYSITRVIPSSLLKKLKKEEDVYD